MQKKPGEITGFHDFVLLGRGGMGEVYSAVNSRLGRREALKVLHASGVDYAARFEREARVAASISKHPNLVTIYNAGVDDDRPWLSMELVDGCNLRDLMLRGGGRLEAEEALFVGRAVAEGLDHLHRKGVVHRDVKPENILIPGGGGVDAAALTDFGIARSADGTDRLTATGMVSGTAAYMAPEQFSSGAIGGAADQYSLACVLFEALTGRSAAEGEEFPALMSWHLNGVRPRVSQCNRLVPASLDPVIIRAMDVDPGNRWRSCADFVDAAFRAYLGGGDGATVGTRDAGGAATVVDARPDVDRVAPSPAAESGRFGVGRTKKRRWPIVAAVSAIVVLAVAWFAPMSPSRERWEGVPAELASDYPEFLPKRPSSDSDAGRCAASGPGMLCEGGAFEVLVERYPDESARDAELQRFQKMELDVPVGEKCVRNSPIDIYPVAGGFLLAPLADGIERDIISVGVDADDVSEFWEWWDRVDVIPC